ncbi:MAG: hypothetical protein ABI690_25290 [Chloroflexota bacterium]
MPRPRNYFYGLIAAVLLGSLLYGFIAVAQVANGLYFSIGKGYTDGIPRQLVRTNADHLYIFTASAQYSSVINVFWTGAAGLPTSAAAFNHSTTLTETANPLSVDAVYDGGTIIHVLVNTNSATANQGTVKDHPFDTATNSFRAPITIDTNTPTVSGDYIGSSGVSGMVAQDGLLHVAYWSNSNHITHKAYTYDSLSNTLTQSGSTTQIDSDGSATHPSIAISPLDDSITIAWVSEATTDQILARSSSDGETWGSIEIVSAATPWTSRNAGVNIDQGPNMLITPDGTRHLLYIEDYDGTGSYGHVHYVTNSGSGWTDTALNFYSHNPGLATNYVGDIYLIGHGAVSTGANKKIYTMKKSSAGTWGTPQQFATPPNGGSFDASPSIKWSVVGFNRPETVEFAFFTPISNNYNNTNIYYGRFSIGGGANPTATPPPNATPGLHYFSVSQPTLTWNLISWALGYQIQIDDDPNFGSPVPVPDEFSADILSYMTDSELADGTYYWHVRAKKNVTDWGSWSAPETFIISAP